MSEALIYKICGAGEWRAAMQSGVYEGSAHDARDGFIHFSTAAQAEATAAKHFAGREGLVLLAVDASALGPALTWEPARDGDLFPHLYVPLPTSAVVTVHDLPLGPDGRHVFPPRDSDQRSS
ncbi:MAG: DUF952 domain-containing protein [Hyphomicrobiales bacterium]|nr:DUF952 domain-containing protein [Hyphomicrobiales bacterium]